ncbi:thiolase family protein [Curvibacter sp. APW13]|uniref:thiolase family protein n=1 Tax=Curvibacter sp. APW13 TaxID=3077236 RepID=UPI0028E03091|nr:thiolase family protein [Curvibacter sp. APW13]MDT8992930.1 thiolase family protein [Curvibacter sp. APW13]
MAEPLALIAAWARSAVAPHGGAFRALAAHDIGTPVLQALLQRAGVAPEAVDAVVLGNALGAGGNPARMLALAAGLPDRCAALSVDTQCCAGLDAVAVGVGLIASGQAQVVVAGGAEAWSRAPIRQHRPLSPDEPAVPYERPAFAPDPARDPDLLQAAADYAAAEGVTRMEQDRYALESHAKALAQREALAAEIVPVAGLAHDAYPRAMGAAMAARLPVQARSAEATSADCAVSTLAISPRADGAALVLLMSPMAARRLGIEARAQWVASASVGADPAMPLLAAESAAHEALRRSGIASPQALDVVELHDAFAVQGLAFCRGLGLSTDTVNRRGGGIARGHPIGASGAMALVRVLGDLQQQGRGGANGLAAVAGAGGIGAATVVRWL